MADVEVQLSGGDKKVKKVKKVTIKKSQTDGDGMTRTTTTVEEEFSSTSGGPGAQAAPTNEPQGYCL